MKKIIFISLLTLFSCREKVSMQEKKISYSNLIEPQNNIYVELLSYYPALNEKQSNFYILKDIHSNDTLNVVDRDNLPIADFIKNYDGLENTAIILEKGKSKSREEYLINTPSDYNLNSKKIYLGELIRLID
ncbi:hypothetical protein [Chryseobacterium sp. 2R14A]|uniref:hypothetical protein n=1 Tax=Chryseobacterium sp. 2R14A TaxID=3380353 RepID=UPI003CFAEEA2